jgi:dTDP-glucose 4,6-dehydratase
MKKRILLTGGAGFIGHHTVEYLLQETKWDIVVLDGLTYAGNLNFLTNLDCWEEMKHRIFFVYHNFCSPISETTRKLIGDINYIVHMGGETHVDRSIENAMPFVHSNIIGTVNMLNYAREVKAEKFIFVSTDEVYGASINGRPSKEGDPHRPSNPYSASKSGAESMVYAYWNTYGVPAMITNTMNNFGERQNPEKFVPRVIRAALLGEKLVLHCRKSESGDIAEIPSRCWLYAKNHADAILFLLENGKSGERYNISGQQATLKEVTDMVSRFTDKKINYVFEDFHSYRPGYDMHYMMDGTKMQEMGWVRPYTFNESLKSTVDWYTKNPKWL